MSNRYLVSPRSFTLFLLILHCLVMVAAPAKAQDDVTGAFEGIVTDGQTNLPVNGAVIEIKNHESGIVIQVETDLEGKFFYARLRPGPYIIRVAKPQYEILELSQNLSIGPTTGVYPNAPLALSTATIIRRSNTTTASGRPPASRFTKVLYIALMRESRSAVTATASSKVQPQSQITSTAKAKGVDPKAVLYRKDGEHAGSFTRVEVQSIPVSSTLVRNFDDFATLLPGVAPPPQTIGSGNGPGVGAGVGSAGQFSVNGMRARDNNFTVDGSDNNDEDIGVRRQGFIALVPQPIESIQEYQVITLLAPAQYGRNIGAQVNAVTRSGGNETHGNLYGIFNSSQLNARNFFDTTSGNAVTPLLSGNQTVLLSPSFLAPACPNNTPPQFNCRLFRPLSIARPITVRNSSGGEDSFTLAQGGFTVGGPLMPSSPARSTSMFYFLSGEGQLLHATQEANFAVPTVAERGIFGTGASSNIGLRDLQGAPINMYTVPVGSRGGNAIFSYFPFPNNLNGIYGANTLTQNLPANGQGIILSGRYEANFKVSERRQSLTARYNFTDDWRELPVTGGAIFSTLRPRVRTQNLSIYSNGELSRGNSRRQIFNQLRFSYGRTRLDFEDVPDREFLRPSSFSDPVSGSFGLLNARLLRNLTSPMVNQQNQFVANTGSVLYVTTGNITTEDLIGPVGQVNIAGYSPVGIDVFNFPQRRVNNTYQLADSVIWHTGNHNYVFGADLRRTELNSDLPRNARPLITFNGVLPSFLPSTGRGDFSLPVDPNTGGLRPLLPTDLAAAGAPSGYFLTLGEPGGSSINLRYYHWHFFWQDEWRITPRFSLSYGLRYEYNTPPRETSGRIERTFNSPDLNLVPGLSRYIDGRTRIYGPDYNNFGPRIGFAYSPRWFKSSNQTTVVRGGYGLYYDQILGSVVSQSRNVFPTFLTVNLAGGLSNICYPSPNNLCGTSFPFTILPAADTGLGLAVPGTINVINQDSPFFRLVDFVNRITSANGNLPSLSGAGATLPARRLQMPMAHHYSFILDQQLSQDMVLSVAYVRTRGSKLLRFTTPNLGPNAYLAVESLGLGNGSPSLPEFFGAALPPGARVTPAGGFTGGRPDRQVGPINLFETTANSRYNALQLSLRGRLRRSLQYMLGYTWSKAVDDVSDIFDLAGAPALPQDSFDLAAERGAANFDVRHRFTYNFIYDLPEFKSGSKLLRALLGGMQIAGTGRFNTGQPFTVNSIFDVNLDGNLTDRLNTTDGLILTGSRRQPLQRPTDDPTQLATMFLAAVGSNGQVKRNSFRAGNVLDLDLALIKSFRVTEGQFIVFRAEVFNFINRANFGIPVRFLEAPAFGQATDTVTPARRIQFVLKYEH